MYSIMYCLEIYGRSILFDYDKYKLKEEDNVFQKALGWCGKSQYCIWRAFKRYFVKLE